MRYLLLPFTPRYILLTIALLGTLALTTVAVLDPETLPALGLRSRFSAPWFFSAFAI